jgi:hypothetical protein
VFPNFFNTVEFIKEKVVFGAILPFLQLSPSKKVVIEEEEVELVLSIREIRKQEGKVSYLDFMTVGYFLGLAGD